MVHTSNLDVPNKSQYLLEIAARPSDVSNATHNAYWVLTVRVARQSAKWEARCGRRLQQSCRRRPTNLLNGVCSSLQCCLLPNKAVTLRRQGDPLTSPRPTQCRQQEATQCTTNCTYQVPDHIFQFRSTTHQKRQQHKQASPWIHPDPPGQVAPRCGSNGKEKALSSACAQGTGPRKGGPSE